MDAAGIKRGPYTHGFHAFRHSAASLIYMKSHDMKLIQGLLGHSAISVTSDVYVHLDESAILEGTKLLTEEILGIIPSNCTLTAPKESVMVN
jgi:integrase